MNHALTQDHASAFTESPSSLPKEWESLRQKVADGLHSTHCRANGNTAKNLEMASFLYALIELLSENDLISIETLDKRKIEVFKRMKKRYENERMGVILQNPQPDKYTFDRAAQIDCENRVHLCKASCCRLPFALSEQDLEERVIRWNLAIPYMIEHDDDGYCVHMDRCKGCTVYEQRPVPCRGYDCRNDKRIWQDFEKRIPNPIVEREDWLELVSEDK